MSASNNIFIKLEAFIKKYYANELLKGIILFVGFGLIYLFVTLFIEYFLWLKPMGRTLLFWTFVGVELFLLSRFILFPLFKLFKLQQGINYEQASAKSSRCRQKVPDLLMMLRIAHGQHAMS